MTLWALALVFYISEQTSLDISCELSAKQTILIKCQDLFSLKNKTKIKKLLCAAVVIGALSIEGKSLVQFSKWAMY